MLRSVAQLDSSNARRWALAAAGALAFGFYVVFLAWNDPTHWLAIGALLAAGGALFLLAWPEAATLVVIFALYTNLPVVAMRYHGVPAWVAGALPVILLVPLAAYVVHQRQKLLLGPVFALMAVYLVVQILAAFGAQYLERSTTAIGWYVVEGMILYVLILNVIRTRATLKRVLWIVLLAGSVMSALAVYQGITHDYQNSFGGMMAAKGSFFAADSEVWRRRPAGPVGDTNFFAQILVVLVPIGIFQALAERRPVLRLAAALASVLIVAGVMVTYSRGAAIALGVSFIAIAYLLRVRLYYLLIGAVVLAVAVSALAPDYLRRIESSAQGALMVGSGGAGVQDASIKGRITEMASAWYVFLDHPWLGVGPDNFGPYYLDYADAVGLRVRTRERAAHDLYLGVAAETGLLGLSAFVGILVAAVWQLRQVRRRDPGVRTELSLWAGAFTVALLGYLTAGLFLHLAFMRYFWLLLALAGAVAQVARREAELPQQDERAAGIQSFTRSGEDLS
ncbi:MAG: O-antigen ligase family protein [Chloroflexi bacterium]|nr:O-antigen ligase family protein [Chloroflexota bacterium]